MSEAVIESSGNVFADLGFPPAEALVLAMRADLMALLRQTIAEKGWTQREAAARLGVGQSRVSDLVRGKHERFSLDMLVTLAARAGRRCEIVSHDAANDPGFTHDSAGAKDQPPAQTRNY